MSLDPHDPRPPYLQIARAVDEAVRSGEYPPGSRLPSGKELAERFNVSRQTVQSALRILKEEGIIYSWQGRGVYVSDNSVQSASQLSDEEVLQNLNAVLTKLQDLDDRMTRVEQQVKNPPAK